MLKKLLAAVGMTLAAGAPPAAAEFYKPYAESHVNFLYNLLFCDDLNLFRNQGNEKRVGLWGTLLAGQANGAALRKIAEDEANEGRVRALAYNRLRAAGEAVPPKKLLGVIVEVSLEKGLDVLAAFSEGGVRYLNPIAASAPAGRFFWLRQQGTMPLATEQVLAPLFGRARGTAAG